MTRLVPPAGAPLPLRIVLGSIVEASSIRRGAGDALCELLSVQNAFWLSSGRAALTVALRALRHGSGRREVIVPAYTCFSVPSAVARAGLTIRLCDVDPKTLDLDPTALLRLDLGRVLAIVPSSLYGLPSDLAGLETVARTAGAFLVDDAAQCLGARLDGRRCGTFGDVGFYSLGRGKGITTMGGGILVTRSTDLARTIEREMRALPRPSVREVLAALAGSLAYGAMLAPTRYALVERLPFLELGVSRFEPDFVMTRLSGYQRRLARRLLPLVDMYNTARRRHAERLRSGIDGVEGIEIPRAAPGAVAVYQRFPMLTRDSAHRSTLLARLRAAGIAASPSYPTSIADIEGIASHLAQGQSPCPGAASVASRVLTLPTHPGVTADDVDRMVAIVRDTG